MTESTAPKTGEGLDTTNPALPPQQYEIMEPTEVSDAQFKCNSCGYVSIHKGYAVRMIEVASEERKTIRVYGCTYCGALKTKKA